MEVFDDPSSRKGTPMTVNARASCVRRDTTVSPLRNLSTGSPRVNSLRRVHQPLSAGKKAISHVSLSPSIRKDLCRKEGKEQIELSSPHTTLPPPQHPTHSSSSSKQVSLLDTLMDIRKRLLHAEECVSRSRERRGERRPDEGGKMQKEPGVHVGLPNLVEEVKGLYSVREKEVAQVAQELAALFAERTEEDEERKESGEEEELEEREREIALKDARKTEAAEASLTLLSGDGETESEAAEDEAEQAEAMLDDDDACEQLACVQPTDAFQGGHWKGRRGWSVAGGGAPSWKGWEQAVAKGASVVGMLVVARLSCRR